MLASTGRVLLWCGIVVLWAIPVLAGDVNGRVIRVLDGDTVEVLHSTSVWFSASLYLS